MHRGKQCLWIAKSTNLLVGQQPKPIDRTQNVRLFYAVACNCIHHTLHDAIMQKGSGMLTSK